MSSAAHPPREELGIEAARRWLALAPEQRADALILAPTHAICRQANEAVREGLAEEGVLRGRTLAVDRLVNRRLTRALASDIRSYEPGDTVVFHRDVFGCRANDVCTVMGHDDGRVVLAHAEGERSFRPSGNAARYLGLYDTERIELREGDLIRWTRNRKAPPARGRHPRTPDLVNGGEAEIVEIGYGRVRFREGGREFSLLRHPDQLQRLRDAPDLLEPAVDELLRYDSPVQLDGRVVREDLEIGGKRLRAGQKVIALLGAANRDPAAFENPEALDIGREQKSHLSFGRGIHYCLGASLALLEARIAFRGLLDRFASIRLADEPSYRDGIVLRGVESLWIEVEQARQPGGT